jgi:hypothetical protein
MKKMARVTEQDFCDDGRFGDGAIIAAEFLNSQLSTTALSMPRAWHR